MWENSNRICESQPSEERLDVRENVGKLGEAVRVIRLPTFVRDRRKEDI